jgi:hypothetical protein
MMDTAPGLLQESGMHRLRRAAAIVTVVVLVLAIVTLVALEGREVVIVHTRAADGHASATRTWVADADGATWIEAANPERPFLRDLANQPEMELERRGAVLRCRAAIVPNPAGHRRIRELLAARYGWADRWIALLADTRRSVAVRLECG